MNDDLGDRVGDAGEVQEVAVSFSGHMFSAQSILFFRQEYERELGDEEYGRYNYNWAYYLESLRLLVETGRGRPYLAETREEKKTVVERFVTEYKNRQNPDIEDELVSEDCRVHVPIPGLPQGREGLRKNGQLMCEAFPDVRVEREFFLVDGDIVVERAQATATHKGELLGTPPTGTRSPGRSFTRTASRTVRLRKCGPKRISWA